MSTLSSESDEDSIQKLNHAVGLLESEDDINRDFLIGAEAPAAETAYSEQNITAYQYYQIPLDSDICQSIQESTASQARGQLEDVDEGRRELEEYDISNIELDSVPLQYIEIDDIERRERFAQIKDADNFDLSSYEEQSDIAFQALRITSEQTGEQVIALQKFTKRQISADSGSVRLAMDEEEYDSFEETVITIPEQFDCLWYNDTIFVFNSKRFEDIFDYLQQYKTHANDVLEGLDESELRIHNKDEFATSIGSDRRALRKMDAVQQRGLYEDLGQADVENVVDEFDLGIKVENNDDGEWGITIPDLRQKWDVIRLLNDDHVVSYVTDLQYQVYGKDLRD